MNQLANTEKKNIVEFDADGRSDVFRCGRYVQDWQSGRRNKKSFGKHL